MNEQSDLISRRWFDWNLNVILSRNMADRLRAEQQRITRPITAGEIAAASYSAAERLRREQGQ